MKRAIFVAFFAAVLIFGDAEAADSVEAIIELGYHYTFEIDSSYSPWSYTFPASDSILIPAVMSDDGSTVVIASYYSDSSYASYHKDFYIFAAGTLAFKIEEIHRVEVNHGGDKVIIEANPDWIFEDYDPDGPDQWEHCLSLDGDTLWSGPILGIAALSETQWSPDDNYIGVFKGAGVLDKMPPYTGIWYNWLVDYLYYDKIYFYNSNYEKIDGLRLESPPDMNKSQYLMDFKEDFSGFLGYKMFSSLDVTDEDTVELYRISAGHPELMRKFPSPIDFPDIDTVGNPTCLNAKWAGFDNRIYFSWGRSNVDDPWDYEYAIQYYCLDTLGNIIWSDVDTSTMSGKLYSKSGKYLVESDMFNENTPAGVILRETATNEILFEKSYPETNLESVEILEHLETGHALIQITKKNGSTNLYYPDGTEKDFPLMKIAPFMDFNFGYKVEGNTLTFYKVRW